MCNHQEGLSPSHKLLERVNDAIGGLAVQVSGGLVPHQQRRIIGQRPGNGRPLLLTARERVGKLVCLVGQAHLLQEHLGPLQSFLRPPPPREVHRKDHVLQNGECGQQLEKLEYDPNSVAAPAGQTVLVKFGEVLTFDEDLTGSRSVDSGNHIEQRRLSTSRRTANTDKLAGANPQIDALECVDWPQWALIVLNDVSNIDQHRIIAHLSHSPWIHPIYAGI